MKRKNPIVALVIFLLAISFSFMLYGIQESENLQFSLLGFIGGSSTQTLEEVDKFKLEVELNNNEKIDMLFHESQKDSSAKVVKKVGNQVEQITDEEALEEIDGIIESLPHPTDSTPLALIEAVLEELKFEQESIKDFELKMHLANGDKIKVELELDIKKAIQK